MTGFKVGYFVGSLSTKSINRLLAKALVGLAPTELEMVEIPFKDLPIYNYDHDASFPPAAVAFKAALAAVDAVLFVTPEYNRSIPGGLKNAIDGAAIEAYIQFEPGLITEDGRVTNKGTEDFLRKYMVEFHGFIERVYTVLPRRS